MHLIRFEQQRDHHFRRGKQTLTCPRAAAYSCRREAPFPTFLFGQADDALKIFIHFTLAAMHSILASNAGQTRAFVRGSYIFNVVFRWNEATAFGIMAYWRTVRNSGWRGTHLSKGGVQ